MTDVELYLTFLSIGSLLLASWGLMQSWKMRSQALDNSLIGANAGLAHAKVTAENSENIVKIFKAIEDDRAAMDLIAKRLQGHDRKLDALHKEITGYQSNFLLILKRFEEDDKKLDELLRVIDEAKGGTN